ncbi:ethanolamine utilization protein EutH [Shigella sonnei]|nr:ethanolamine utilization protein EutH [Shigella sonnei]
MGINEIIMYIMMFFMLIAAVDRILSQFGGSARFLGKFGKSIEGSGGQFEEGFMAMGALGLAMVGMTALAPVLAHVLGPVIIPVYEMLGANPSMFAGTLLACDMGGFFLAKELAGGGRSSVAILWVNSWVDDGANDCVFHSGGARHYRTF